MAPLRVLIESDGGPSAQALVERLSDAVRLGAASDRAEWIPSGQALTLIEPADHATELDVVLLLLDEEASDGSGWHAAAPVVALLRVWDPQRAQQLRRAGAMAVLPYASPASQIVAAVVAVASGLTVIDHRATDAQPQLPVDAAGGAAAPLGQERPTPRELEVLELLGAGLSNKAIAAELTVSEHTVKFHVASILGKLRVTSRAAAVTAAIRRGWLTL